MEDLVKKDPRVDARGLVGREGGLGLNLSYDQNIFLTLGEGREER